ncbi:hypothetical protein [Salarchaeum japonicum]|uniref:DUF7964 domain-containing protein n=1 Tax=Salarchaeum japonicum TaxID=555573 RepID=A0AAV3T281_9EURY|nr:hypothetical protein [Salarchaeum japonicum]
MDLSSLPSRPLTGREVAALDESGTFVAVRPVERFEFEAVEETLVVAVVLITTQGVRGVAFDPERGWRVVHRADRDDIEELADVPESAIDDAQRALRAEITDLERERGFGSRLVDAYETHS